VRFKSSNSHRLLRGWMTTLPFSITHSPTGSSASAKLEEPTPIMAARTTALITISPPMATASEVQKQERVEFEASSTQGHKACLSGRRAAHQVLQPDCSHRLSAWAGARAAFSASCIV